MVVIPAFLLCATIPTLTRAQYPTHDHGRSIQPPPDPNQPTATSEPLAISTPAIPLGSLIYQLPPLWPYATSYANARVPSQTSTFYLTHPNTSSITCGSVVASLGWNPRPLFTPADWISNGGPRGANKHYNPFLTFWSEAVSSFYTPTPTVMEPDAMSVTKHSFGMSMPTSKPKSVRYYRATKKQDPLEAMGPDVGDVVTADDGRSSTVTKVVKTNYTGVVTVTVRPTRRPNDIWS